MGALRTPLVCKFLMISLILVGLSSISIANASKVHVVGGTKLWGFAFPYNTWTVLRSFTAGDTLVFKYPVGAQNTIRVNVFGYRSCKATARESAKALWTGKDKCTLKKEIINYFICGIPGQCSAGMEIKVFAK
ncbi:hypothetical protein MKW98_023489 [Papaver atlanticum]|uniref:Phytocyanin domain-containing protein n=1 Tax=Papaver atlanticum TaxID=357466 RepID=A0AAD4SWS5_9MAGN|nr:hypothetical protein MKW98_023489 [Papaver atlanticum]